MCGALVAGSASAQSRTACRAVKLTACERAWQDREGKGKEVPALTLFQHRGGIAMLNHDPSLL